MEFPSAKGPLDRLKGLPGVRKVFGEGEKPPIREVPVEDGDSVKGDKTFLERTTKAVVGKIYTQAADDLEDRAVRVAEKAYENSADDLEERAVRAMRRALTDESDRIQAIIEHAVEVKKREVRLSLLVLVAAAVVYLLLEAFAAGGGGVAG